MDRGEEREGGIHGEGEGERELDRPTKRRFQDEITSSGGAC